MSTYISDRAAVKLLTGVLIFTDFALITAMRDVHKYEKQLKKNKRGHDLMTKALMGVVEVACNPKTDPMENREAVNKIFDDVMAEALLDNVDFSGVLERFKSDG